MERALCTHHGRWSVRIHAWRAFGRSSVTRPRSMVTWRDSGRFDARRSLRREQLFDDRHHPRGLQRTDHLAQDRPSLTDEVVPRQTVARGPSVVRLQSRIEQDGILDAVALDEIDHRATLLAPIDAEDEELVGVDFGDALHGRHLGP